MKQSASAILMIEPVRFAFNPDSARTNHFMRDSVEAPAEQIQARALAEFRELVATLRGAGVSVFVRRDEAEPHTPDSIFPNNWISFHRDGRVVLYPLEPPNRRLERRRDIIRWLSEEQGFAVREIVDLTHHELEGRFLEGTGSMVFDRPNGVIYASISPRTTPALLEEYAGRYAKRVVSFHSLDASGAPVYHTNVVMAVGTEVAVVCGDAIRRASERERVFDSLRKTGHEVIDISMEQLHAFVGNMIELETASGEKKFAMSQGARESLSESQLRALERYGELVSSPIPTIETYGGGSVRCMVAEIFLPRKTL